ncbi:cytokine receptor common subunit beta [Zootoca vivipara]|uniref:cytokine receptor common subunit beta n=1 Tax=Zootoca vivipara TaxID=8524 RepID=UPI001591096B|nr:cytokine receptor common subunit beta [Zootoca vivipara]
MRCCSIALALSLFSYVVEAQQKSPMETLDCFSDYVSHTACTWNESRDARNFVKMKLLHSDTYQNNLTQMTCHSEEEDSQIHWSCHKNQTIFNVWLNNIFIFKPDQELKVQVNVSLFDNVRPPPPHVRDVVVTEDGDYLLAWEAGGGTNKRHWLDGALNFEVTYKRRWELWEDSTSILMSNTSKCLFLHDDLVPGSPYVARVRSIPRQGGGLVGRYSKWSRKVYWETPKTWKDGAEAQPKNLRCLFNGIDQLNCSWEVRQEVTSSVSFTLFYKASPETGEKECSPVLQMELPSTRYVLQSCEINVTNPERISQYLVTVRPKEEEKVMEAAKHIKAGPPFKLSVSTQDNQEHSLKWEVRNSTLRIPETYQISYWKTGKPSEDHLGNSDDTWFTFPSELLEQDTSYTAKVRAKVRGYTYDGPWSEWSKEIEWTTLRVVPPWSIILIAAVSVIVMMAGMCFCHSYLLRKSKNWKEAIPHPPKTLLLPNLFPRLELLNGSQDSSSQSSGEEVNSCTLESQRLVSHPEPLEASSSGKTSPHSTAFQHVKGTEPPVANAGQFLDQPDKPPCSHKARKFDFDGPYLLFPSESSPPENQKDSEVASLERKETSVAPQFVGLPRCSSFQQLPPVGKEEEPPASPVFVREQEKQQLLQRQESRVASDRLEKEANEGLRSQSLTRTKNHGRNESLDYIATEDLSLTKERDFLFPSPLLASKARSLLCSGMATAASQLTPNRDDISRSQLVQKKEAGPGHPANVPVMSQDSFSDYVTSMPQTPRSVPKEGLPFSPDEPKHKGFLLFHPGGNSSPVLLSQVGEYCFFPGSMTMAEASKSQTGSEVSQKGTKPLCEDKHFGNKLQSTPALCQDLRVGLPHAHA